MASKRDPSIHDTRDLSAFREWIREKVREEERRAVTILYEAPVEEQWQIISHVRAHFLSARDEQGEPRFPRKRYLFPYAHTAEELASVRKALTEAGTNPDLLVVNLYGIDEPSAKLMHPWVATARLMYLSRGRDGDPREGSRGLPDTHSMVREMMDRGGLGVQYGPADRDAKIAQSIRWIEGQLERLAKEHGEGE